MGKMKISRVDEMKSRNAGSDRGLEYTQIVPISK